MNELISLNQSAINGELQQTVNARELYTQLGLDKSNWARWTKQNIVANPFALENKDWVGFVIMTNGNETTDYALTLDLAKKLAMQVKTENGELVREYFLTCEKKLKEQTVPLTFAEALRAYADEVESHEQTKQTLAIAEPKAQYFDNLVERNLLSNFTITAKEFGIKRKDLIDYLLVNKYVYRDAYDNIVAYAAHVPHLFEIKEFAKEKHAGTQTLITPHGRETFRLLMGI